MLAFALISDAKKGLSALQLGRNLGVHYETAWTMYMKTREMMLEPICLDNVVEIDSTMLGGKPRKKPTEISDAKKARFDKKLLQLKGTDKEIRQNLDAYKKSYPKEKPKTGAGADRPVIAGIVERDGDVVAQVMSSLKYGDVKALVEKHVNKEKAVLISDGEKSFVALSRIIDNIVIDHKTMYAHKGVHTNTIESFWAIIKRGVHGQYHHISDEYLPNYVTEFVFKWNNRNEDDMFETLVRNSMKSKKESKPTTEGCKTN